MFCQKKTNWLRRTPLFWVALPMGGVGGHLAYWRGVINLTTDPLFRVFNLAPLFGIMCRPPICGSQQKLKRKGYREKKYRRKS